MAAFFHHDLTQEKWNKLSWPTQILNIASELSRAKNLMVDKEKKYTQASFDRAFELIDLTINDAKWGKSERRKFLRLREFLGEFYMGHNQSVDDFKIFLRALLSFDKDSALVEI